MDSAVAPDLLVQLGWAVEFGVARFDDDAAPVPFGKVEAGFGTLLE